jgi:hypothetical protein
MYGFDICQDISCPAGFMSSRPNNRNHLRTMIMDCLGNSLLCPLRSPPVIKHGNGKSPKKHGGFSGKIIYEGTQEKVKQH